MSLSIACPAATEVSPPTEGPSVVCGVLESANDGAHLGGVRARGQVSALMSGRTDRGTVRGFCCAAYMDCAIWRAQRDSEEAHRRTLVDGQAQRHTHGGPDPRVAGALDALRG